jgi:hypothetical protein
MPWMEQAPYLGEYPQPVVDINLQVNTDAMGLGGHDVEGWEQCWAGKAG